MTINKLTGNIQPLDEVDKINEIIDGKQDTLVSGTNIKTINSNSILGSGNLQLDGLPSQTGNAGKFLQTDGTDASWQGVPGRNIGEIVASTIPLTDAGLHLLDGALIQGSGIYSDFVDYIADLYDSGDYTAIFETEANWQTSVTTYGVCGKFVYDSVNNTVRLPKITGKLDGTTDLTALGDLVEQYVKLPNITGHFGVDDSVRNTATGAFYNGANWDYDASSGGGNGGYIEFDASRSSSVYSGNGSDTKIHEQAINVLYYIVIATTTKTDIQVDIDEVTTDLNGKADVDLTNVNNAGTSTGASWGMPSNTYDDLTLGASGSTYTAPANGWLLLYLVTNNDNSINHAIQITVNGREYGNTLYGGGMRLYAFCPILKGEVATIEYARIASTRQFRFYYAQGSESEAS